MRGIYCQAGSCQDFDNCKDFDLLDPFWKQRTCCENLYFFHIAHATIANLYIVFIKYFMIFMIFSEVFL